MTFTVRFLSIALIVAGSSCATSTKETKTIQGSRSQLFPFGTYQHRVRVKLKTAKIDGREELGFLGVVESRADKLSVIGLSPFGTTLFRLIEDRKTGETKFETEMDSLKKAEPYVRASFAPLRQLLWTPWPMPTGGPLRVLRSTADNWPIEVESSGAETSAKYTFEGYDANHIPRRILISQDRFDINVGVEAYEL